jgi:hypothetical protein
VARPNGPMLSCGACLVSASPRVVMWRDRSRHDRQDQCKAGKAPQA